MKLKNLALCFALVGATAFVTSTVVSQDHPSKEHPGQDHPGQEQPEWMTPEVMARLSPNENHKFLGKFVGTWHQDLKHWESPGSEPHEMSGVVTYSWLIEGRYLKGKYEGDFGGMPFVGYEVMGYDNMNEEYFSIWVDSFGTGYMISTGQLRGDTMTMSGTTDDPMSGRKDVVMRSVGKVVDDDTMTFEMYTTAETGEFKVMEMTSKRKK